MDLSISIANWNTRDLLDQCLRSIYDTTHGIEFEIIVVDNASSDGSVGMARDEYPDVRVVANENNLGYARANNQAYALSTGRYFLALNSDTLIQDCALNILVEWMDAHPECGACGPVLLNADGTLQPSWAKMPTFWSEARGYHDRRISGKDMSRLNIVELSGAEPFEVGWVGGACIAVSRDAIERVGLMDEGYYMYSEETDWCWRIGRAGYAITCVPQSRVVHLGGASSKMAPVRTLVRCERSRLRFMWRSGGWNRIMSLPLAGVILAKTVARVVRNACISLFRRLETNADRRGPAC